MSTVSPPYLAPSDLTEALRRSGFALLRPADLAALAGLSIDQLDTLLPSWDRLELDNYLKDGGRYRQRRHSCFIDEGGQLTQTPHRAHWQPVEYNALHGGMHRLFAPIEDATIANPVWSRLLLALGQVCSNVRPSPRWHVEAHQFRIDTANGIGRPTPEGAHRDGVDFVAVLLVGRRNVKGGETRVFDANGPAGQRFTLDAPWTLMLLDDATVIHETTPIQPLDGIGQRDTLVLTWRAQAFLGDD